MQEKRQSLERITESLSQDYEAYEAEKSHTRSEMSNDDNKSRRQTTNTLEISTKTDSDEEKFPDHLFRPVPEVMSTLWAGPRDKPRKSIKKENQNLPSREVTIGENTKTISTTEYCLHPSTQPVLKSLTGQMNFTNTAESMLQDLMNASPKCRILT